MSGEKYIGQFRFGKPWGYGKYFYNNSSYYEGYFKNGVK